MTVPGVANDFKRSFSLPAFLHSSVLCGILIIRFLRKREGAAFAAASVSIPPFLFLG